MMKRLFNTTLVVAVLLGPALEAHAERLADRIPAVSGRLYPKTKRLELTPFTGLSHNDAFYQMVPLGARLQYHFSESLAVGFGGEYRLGFEKNLVIIDEGSEIDQQSEFDRPALRVGGELQWIPFYGKVSLMAETFAHFDAGFALGAGTIRSDQGEGGLYGSLAYLQRFFLTKDLALAYRLRLTGNPQDRSGDVSSKWETELSSTLGVSLFFGGPKE